MVHSTELWQAYRKVCENLLAARVSAGHWVGYLASSALATATAVGALALVERHSGRDRPELPPLISAGLEWLARGQNPDGGWGDTDRSPSNLATTLLVRSAVQLAGRCEEWASRLHRAETYIQQEGGLEGLRRRYGEDQTFAVPILTTLALAGLVDWQQVAPLPFEWASLPHRILGWVGLPVVSYAIPALVAMGQARFFHLPPRNPVIRWLRQAVVHKTLAVVEAKQPASGGFLEAAPLTSFVVMALSATNRAEHPVVERGVRFLIDSVRPDGSWPIDTNLATWVTTLSLNALLCPWAIHSLSACESKLSGLVEGVSPTRATAEGSPCDSSLLGSPWEPLARKEIARACLKKVLGCQHRQAHPFTAAAPGGWGWTDLSGAVPDADDTSGALFALVGIYQELQSELSATDQKRIGEAVAQGLRWLLELQNRDGGWPTFCRGWGTLPFDRSTSDLTAHALRALAVWRTWQALDSDAFAGLASLDLDRAIARGRTYLARTQKADGSWTPLWFGNAYWPGEENPIYGTARVLLAYRDLGEWDSRWAQRGRAWLLAHQNLDGGWGGRPLTASGSSPPLRVSSGMETDIEWNRADWQSSVEETALAVEALLTDPNVRLAHTQSVAGEPTMPTPESAATRGVAWLVRAVQEDRHCQAEPIGLYFARLWYYEKLYPVIFTVSALSEAVRRTERPHFLEPGRE